MSPHLLTMLVALLGGTGAADAVPPPHLMRIAILDTSGSMAGERLDTARKELLDFARQLPPAPAYPFVIVPFNGAAHDVRTFTELPALEGYLAKVQAGGDTSIASGLERALAELKPYANVKHVCVLLYTDGEDGDAEGIHKQEEQLDRLFSARSQQGLRQSVVFCKRWEQANADLLARLTKAGHAQIVDAGDLRLVPVTLTPSVTVVRAGWSKDRPGVLEVELTAKLDWKGSGNQSLAPVRFVCRNAGAEGDVQAPVRPGDATPTAFSLRLPVTAAARAAGRVDVEFELGQPADVKASDGLLLPLLSLDRLQVPVPLPARPVHCKVKASMAPAGLATWVDPVRRRAAFPLTVSCEVQCASEAPASEAVLFHIRPDPGCHLTAGQDAFRVAGPGTVSVALTLDADAIGAASAIAVGVTLTPDAPADITFDPPTVHLAQDLPPPPPVQTTVSTRVRSLTAAHWIDLKRGTAAFEADVEFRVDGPIAADTEITLQCPPAVHDVRLAPSKITTGVQTVRVALEAELPPAPAPKTLVFQVLPPAVQGAVQIRAAGSLRLSVVGPPPAQIVLLRSGTVEPTWETTIGGDKDDVAVFSVTPTVVGLTRPEGAEGLTVYVRSGLTPEADEPARLPMNAPADLPLKAPEGTAFPFFFDSLVEGDVMVEPAPPSPALVGSSHHVVLRREAPFKRLLFYLAAAVGALLTLYFLARLWLRLTTYEIKR